MEELKQLADILKELPTLGFLILGGYFMYKLVIVGSIFAVIKLVVTRLTDMVSKGKTEATKIKQTELDNEALARDYKRLKELKITGVMPELMELLTDIKNNEAIGGRSWNYVNSSDLKWVREAIDQRIEREVKNDD